MLFNIVIRLFIIFTFIINNLLANPIQTEPFRCADNGKVLEKWQINDNYCDCEDGSDELLTSACFNGKFKCKKSNDKNPKYIPTSLVDDGICDCCDGSDEIHTGVNCVDKCIPLNLKTEISEETHNKNLINLNIFDSLNISDFNESQPTVHRDLLENENKTNVAMNSINSELDKEIKAGVTKSIANHFNKTELVDSPSNIDASDIAENKENNLHLGEPILVPISVSNTSNYINQTTNLSTDEKQINLELPLAPKLRQKQENILLQKNEKQTNPELPLAPKLRQKQENILLQKNEFKMKRQLSPYDLFGPYKKLLGLNFNYTDPNQADIQYIFIPFKRIIKLDKTKSISYNLGYFRNWLNVPKYTHMVYTDTDNVSKIKTQSLVTFECDVENSIEKLIVLNQHAYWLVFKTPIACKADAEPLTTPEPNDDLNQIFYFIIFLLIFALYTGFYVIENIKKRK